MNKLKPDCMRCLINRHLTKFPNDTPEEKQVEYMQRLFKLFAEAPLTLSAPVLSRDVEIIRQEMFGSKNEYGEIKKYFNKVMMGYENKVKENINASSNPLKLAVQYAMVGNYIDFGAMKNVDEDYLDKLLCDANHIQVNPDEYKNMLHDLETSEKMVFITDNCGEVVMDKILIETIQKLYPHLDITVMVRGEEVLNDATMIDAEQIGLTNIVKVIGNGTAIPGTHLEELNGVPLEILEEADVILAKGQGNFETLRGCEMNVYYLFLCKCDMFAKDFGVEKFTGMLINDHTWTASQR